MLKKEKTLISAMKDWKNYTADIIKSTHSIAFVFFVIIDRVLDYYLYPLTPEGLFRVLFKVIIEVGLYTLIHRLVDIIANIYIDLKEKQYAIQGLWYHVHIPHIWNEVDYDRTNLRCGETTIKRQLYDFCFASTNSNYHVDADGKTCVAGDTNTTTWNTIISEISKVSSEEYNIIEVYKASTNESSRLEFDKCPLCEKSLKKTLDAGQSRYGIHKYKVDETSLDAKLGYTRICVKYSDCWPSYKNGELWLFRSEEERDKRIEQYFAEKKKHDAEQV